MAKIAVLPGDGVGPAHVTGPGSGRPLARRLLELVRRARGVLVASLVLWCAGLIGVASAATITEFSPPTALSGPLGITAGPDGALWFTENNAKRIGRITTAGTITEFPIPTAASPQLITAGPDGALWFTDINLSRVGIGRITTAGAISQFSLPTSGSGADGITAGPDGALWFTEFDGNRIGRITTAGTITEFPLPTAHSLPIFITAGPDGALWFTESGENKIGRITTGGTITEFAIPTPNSTPAVITAGPDGALWFTEASSNKIGRITTAGAITEFPIPTPNSTPVGITAGPDGALWFTEQSGNKIGRITTAGTITEFPLPTAGSLPDLITAGPDGALWFTEIGANKIGRITTGNDPALISAFVTRLYQTVLLREPDPAGLAAHVQNIQQFGTVIPTVLAFFHSAEFLSQPLTDDQFLDRLYHTFLNRAPDPAGLQAFQDLLASGCRTRDTLIAALTFSDEFKSLVPPLPVADLRVPFVAELYAWILNRPPDPALQGWVTQLTESTALATVLSFLHSPEFTTPRRDTATYVTALYLAFLGRPPDCGGLTFWVTTLTQQGDTEAARDQVAGQFAASPEFQAKLNLLFP